MTKNSISDVSNNLSHIINQVSFGLFPAADGDNINISHDSIKL